MQTKVSDKSSELTAVLYSHLGGKINLARIKLISHFVKALCIVQTVTFEKLANAFNTEAKPESSLRRLQRFIASFEFNPNLIAMLIFNLLPQKKNLMLAIDRTNWKFGEVDINIFMLGVVYQGVAFPLLFTMLPKRGNSNCAERIALVERFIGLFGREAIGAIMADREFVGKDWLDYLNRKQLRYYIRIRNNFKVYLPDKNKMIKASHLFNHLDVNQFHYYSKIIQINNVYCYISGCKMRDDFLIVVSFNKPEQAQDYYKQRWQIEMCFKALKSSGFDIENTHLRDIERVEKLLLLVMIAFVWCYKVGIFLHQKIPITIKTHGRKAKSIFKYGLNHIMQVLLNANNQNDIDIFKFLSCT
ncbi:IS4 family transposase [Dysgonomonas sp. 521]|uniref:IS4 family transposase n=1 Tax=Dysgonomonas sp. 521 TaxID=2302932 RepID=UPI0013CFE1FF|nr:IS4 family transposase [Dysgonomonas sp. 521]NDV97633.1 IS4 family transposase [Dysgonomonas sp. 521]